jgi:hypothetical protein
MVRDKNATLTLKSRVQGICRPREYIPSEPYHHSTLLDDNMVTEQRHSKKRKRSSRKEGSETTDATVTTKVENEATVPDLKQEKDSKKRCRESERKHDEKQSANTDNGVLSATTDAFGYY